MIKINGAEIRKATLPAVLGCALALSLSLPSLALAAPTAASKKAEAEAALASLDSMRETLNEASNKHWEAVQAQEKAEQLMAEAQARLEDANGKIGSYQDKLGVRTRSMYRAGASSVLELLLGATSFEEFATNWDLLSQMNQNDAALVSETKQLRETIQSSKREYAAQAEVAKQKVAEAKKIEDEAQETVASMQATYDSLSAEAAELLEQERAAQAAAEQARAAQVVREAAAAAASQASSGSGGGSSSTSGGGSAAKPTPKPQPSYNPGSGNAIVSRAYSAMGQPYVWGGVGPNGYDCSGLVSYAVSGSHRRLGTAASFLGWQRVSDPQPGDICTNTGHCGVYIGNGQMVHAPTFGQTVSVGPVQRGMVFVRP